MEKMEIVYVCMGMALVFTVLTIRQIRLATRRTSTSR